MVTIPLLNEHVVVHCPVCIMESESVSLEIDRGDKAAKYAANNQLSLSFLDSIYKNLPLWQMNSGNNLANSLQSGKDKCSQRGAKQLHPACTPSQGNSQHLPPFDTFVDMYCHDWEHMWRQRIINKFKKWLSLSWHPHHVWSNYFPIYGVKISSNFCRKPAYLRESWCAPCHTVNGFYQLPSTLGSSLCSWLSAWAECYSNKVMTPQCKEINNQDYSSLWHSLMDWILKRNYVRVEINHLLAKSLGNPQKLLYSMLPSITRASGT